MGKAFFLIWIVTLALLMISCNFGDDDELFFYTKSVVGDTEEGGTNTDATWSYKSDGFIIIMTRWDDTWLSERALTKSEAEILEAKTTFSLTLTPTIDPNQIDTQSVERFHNGYEVTQRFHFLIPKGSYTLVGTTTDSVTTTVRTDTINLTIN